MLYVEIIGNLGSDPEERYAADGKPMVSIRVAVNSRRKGADGEQIERTDWFRARMGGGRADYVARELRKGSRVLVRGRLEIGEWTTREGEQRTSYDIWADDVVNLTARDTAPREDAPRQEPAVAPSGASSASSGTAASAGQRRGARRAAVLSESTTSADQSPAAPTAGFSVRQQQLGVLQPEKNMRCIANRITCRIVGMTRSHVALSARAGRGHRLPVCL
jgi:single-strand DNA-binding protein